MTGTIQKAVATRQEAQVQEHKDASPAALMKSVLNSKSMQDIIHGSLKENAGAFTASLIELYSTDDLLKRCQPGKVAQEALKAVSLKLPINKQLGFAYIIPYKDGKSGETLPQFQLGYKGYIQLCMRTGAYKYLNAGPVYDGELKSHDKLTGAIDLSGEATSDKVVGYFAYIETMNGFRKCLYWTKEKVISHAKTHSKSYNAGNKIWRDFFDEMASKTVLRNLLSKYGVMSVEMEKAFSSEVGELADNAIKNDSQKPDNGPDYYDLNTAADRPDNITDDGEIIDAEYSESGQDATIAE